MFLYMHRWKSFIDASTEQIKFEIKKYIFSGTSKYILVKYLIAPSLVNIYIIILNKKYIKNKKWW